MFKWSLTCMGEYCPIVMWKPLWEVVNNQVLTEICPKFRYVRLTCCLDSVPEEDKAKEITPLSCTLALMAIQIFTSVLRLASEGHLRHCEAVPGGICQSVSSFRQTWTSSRAPWDAAVAASQGAKGRSVSVLGPVVRYTAGDRDAPEEHETTLLTA